MQHYPFPLHWTFAFVAAISSLEELIWQFDLLWSKTQQKGFAFVGVRSPQELIEVIDGFLSEQEKLLKSDVTRLEEAKKTIIDHIWPNYQLGHERARQCWANATSEELSQFAEYDFSDFHKEGESQLPEGLSNSNKSWFMEGFSRSWQQEWMDYHKRFLNVDS